MSKKPIIIVKKARAHAGHHGGAWKVAYADFVTAMMALFIVLWLMNTSDHVRKVIAGYFNDPRGRSEVTGTDRSGSTDNMPLTRENMEQFKDRLEKAIVQTEQFKHLSNQIEITVTPEGLRIELLESKNGTFFETGSATLNETGRKFLTMLAGQLKDVPNNISLEGHTDSQPYANDAAYSNWELSADRANASRREFLAQGVPANRISRVVGMADRDPLVANDPTSPRNRRISVVLLREAKEAAPAPANPQPTPR